MAKFPTAGHFYSRHTARGGFLALRSKAGVRHRKHDVHKNERCSFKNPAGGQCLRDARHTGKHQSYKGVF